MRREKLLGLSAVAVLSLGLLIEHRIAAAQDPFLPPPAPPFDANTGLARTVTASPEEMLGQTEQSLGRMETARTTIRRMLETARAQRDVVKTLCLNDKLNQMDVALRSGRERRQALELAVSRRDADLANHEFTILNVLRQRSDQLTAEANLCIGKEAEYIGDSAVSGSIDPGLPEEDPSEYPNEPVIVEPPVCSSCFN
ncbi:MAG TPA: hypothetical protein VE093_02160 [Polyangiaceae bacterium]|jgi:hypothetical protein|nr:hypothetical protein [Polyangiaceae bacterium]